MSKQYGLIVPNKDKSLQPAIRKPSIFNEDSDSEEAPLPSTTRKSIKRQDRIIQEKAVEEDPTVFQYDELYDDMQEKRRESKLSRKDLDRKPKYIAKLLQTADRRKRENERRIERQVQKEREQEGETFRDKESFVTSAYRKKLEEMKELEEQEKREEYLESIGDVRKQGNLDGFYRHLYDQKVNYGEEETVQEKKEEKKEEGAASRAKQKSRKYRKRLSSGSEQEEPQKEIKMEHLPSNIDADSDFSIDSSDSEDEGKETTKALEVEIKEEKPDGTDAKEAKVEVEKEEKGAKRKEEEDGGKEEEAKPKKPKIDIWKKRTVGKVFEEALQRYFERKALRESRL